MTYTQAYAIAKKNLVVRASLVLKDLLSLKPVLKILNGITAMVCYSIQHMLRQQYWIAHFIRNEVLIYRFPCLISEVKHTNHICTYNTVHTQECQRSKTCTFHNFSTMESSRKKHWCSVRFMWTCEEHTRQKSGISYSREGNSIMQNSQSSTPSRFLVFDA